MKWKKIIFSFIGWKWLLSNINSRAFILSQLIMQHASSRRWYTPLMNSKANISTISRTNYFIHLYPVFRMSSNQWQEFGWKKEHMFGMDGSVYVNVRIRIFVFFFIFCRFFINTLFFVKCFILILVFSHLFPSAAYLKWFCWPWDLPSTWHTTSTQRMYRTIFFAT